METSWTTHTYTYIYIYTTLYNYISWNVYHIARTTNICISNPFSLQVPLHHSSSFNSSSRRAASAAACCGSVALVKNVRIRTQEMGSTNWRTNDLTWFNHETWDSSNITSMKLGIFLSSASRRTKISTAKSNTRNDDALWVKQVIFMANHGEPWWTILAKIDMPQDSPEDHSMGNLNHP